VVNKRWKEGSAELMMALAGQLSGLSDFSATAIETGFNAFLVERELGVGAVLPLFRLLVTGEGGGPSMFDIAAYLGKDETVARIQSGCAKLG
jgi:glutamyl-tRNA synthetase